MKDITIMVHDDGDHDSEAPVHDANRCDWLGTSALKARGVRCPKCDARRLVVQAIGQPHHDEHRTWQAVGCVICCEHVGTARWERATIFGATEDDAVLNGRPRVYGAAPVEGHGDEAAAQFAREVEVMGGGE